VSIAFAEKESAGFVNGTGVKQPRGFLQYPTVANASYAWGSLGFVVTGAAAVPSPTSTASPADAIIDLYYSLKAGYRNGANFVTSDAVMGTIRKFKDGQGNYLWAPPTGTDMPATILGKPVVTDDNMPALGAGQLPGRVRQLPARLPDRRPVRRPRAARSVHPQAVCPLLHHEARRRRRRELRGAQAAEVQHLSLTAS
jgi:HK97 family phage major capsid protein